MKIKYLFILLLMLAPRAYAVDIDAPGKAVDKKTHCMKAIGNKKFCDCFAKNIPADVGFPEYIEFFTLTPKELDVKNLSPDGKALYTEIQGTHDKCVKK